MKQFIGQFDHPFDMHSFFDGSHLQQRKGHFISTRKLRQFLRYNINSNSSTHTHTHTRVLWCPGQYLMCVQHVCKRTILVDTGTRVICNKSLGSGKRDGSFAYLLRPNGQI